MRKTILCVAAALLLSSGIAVADDYREVWQCTVKDDSTIDDVQAVNSKWLAWVHKNVNKNVASAILTAVVGNLDGFMYVDTYPSLAVWSAVREAQDASEEGAALDAEFDAVSDCSENRVWRRRPTA